MLPHRTTRALTLLPAVLAGLLAACGQTPSRPNVVLVTFDTTRADRLSCYGYGRETTPNLDLLAADGLRATRAYAVTSWTLPSHASLFTGKFPSAHGARYDPEGPLNLVQEGGIRGNPAWSRYRARPLAATEITLAQVFKESGYATGAVVAGPWMKRVFGLGKGFESYDDSNFVELGSVGELNGRDGADVTRAAIEFVDAHAEQPFLLFLNYYDPHGPWLPRPEFLARFWSEPVPNPPTQEFNDAAYDAELYYADQQFGRLLEHLKARGLYEDAWIVVTSDHGELMGEHGLMGHGNSLSEAEIRIPWIVKEPGPARPRGVDDTPVQQTDLMPLLLDRIGLPRPPNMQGTPTSSRRPPIVAEVYPLPFTGSDDWRQQGDWRVIVEGRFKYGWNSLGRHVLYDLEADPLEGRNLLPEEGERAARLEDALQRFIESLPEPGELGDVQDVDAETLELLRGLGYVGDDD